MTQDKAFSPCPDILDAEQPSSAFLTVKGRVRVKGSASCIFNNKKFSPLLTNPSFTEHFFNHFLSCFPEQESGWAAFPSVLREESGDLRNCQVHESRSRRATGPLVWSRDGKTRGTWGACWPQGQRTRGPGRQGCGWQGPGPGLRVREEAQQSREDPKGPAWVATRQNDIRAGKVQYMKAYRGKRITPTLPPPVPLPKSVYSLQLTCHGSPDSAHVQGRSWRSGPVCFYCERVVLLSLLECLLLGAAPGRSRTQMGTAR